MNTEEAASPLRRDWRSQAACLRADAELFHPISRAADVAAAKRWCSTCPVRRPCLDEAIAQADDWSIRGGLTADERRALAGRGPRRAERRTAS